MPLFGPPSIEKLKEKLKAALGRANLGNRRPVEPLIAALKDEDESVREEAAQTLRNIGGAEAERALAEYRARQQ